MNVKQILLHLINANIHFLFYVFLKLSTGVGFLPTGMTTMCFPMCHWFVLQEKRQFVPWMTTIPNFEAFFGMAIEVKFLIPFADISHFWLPKKQGEIIVKNGATFSLTVVFVVFLFGWVLVKISWRWNSSVWWSNELRFSDGWGNGLCGDL